MEHKTHCDTCIKTDKCLRLNTLRKGNPEQFISCPIVTCRFSCLSQFHQCKKDEHELLCPNIKVPCINKEFGCPVLLERRLISKHLPKCPASVIACTMEWNRWPLPPGKNQPFVMDSSQLDVAATLKDQRVITEWKQMLPHSLKNTLRSYTNEKHPSMPLAVAGHRIPRCIISKGNLEKEAAADFSESTESDHDESSDSPWGAKKSPPGLQESVCNKLKTIKINRSPVLVGNGTTSGSHNPGNASSSSTTSNTTATNNGQASKSKATNNGNGETHPDEEFHSCSSVIEEDDEEDSSLYGGCVLEKDSNVETSLEAAPTATSTSKVNKSKELNLNLVVEVITRSHIKPDSMYTFMCAREFRRDEYSNHFANIHSGIHTQLNGWLFARCPLANQGCSFGTEKMFPNDKNYRIVFNEVLDAFCFTQIPQEGDTTDTQDYISSLPFELLIHLTKYLDPLSLNALSMTSTLFREVCEAVIVERGLVILHWERHPTLKKWEVVEKKWFFSTSFSPIKKWSFADIGIIANHMKTCSYFDRNVPSAPFRYYGESDEKDPRLF